MLALAFLGFALISLLQPNSDLPTLFLRVNIASFTMLELLFVSFKIV